MSPNKFPTSNFFQSKCSKSPIFQEIQPPWTAPTALECQLSPHGSSTSDPSQPAGSRLVNL